MSVKKPKVLKGFRDILPELAIAKSEMLVVLRKQFELFGFAPIETPHLEYTELLIDETEGEIGKQLYRFRDNGDRDVCLRFDLTVPFARFFVQYQHELGVPFKRYAIGNVFRAEKPQFGRYREFTQCDIDIVGTKSRLADAEIVSVMAASLKALGISNFQIRINNRKLMNGIASACGFETKAEEVLRIVDKIDKIGREKVEEELKGEGLDAAQCSTLFSFLDIGRGTGSEQIEKLEAFACDSKLFDEEALFKEGVSELKELVRYLTSIESQYVIDVTIARGLGYYTGTVFETNLMELPEIGSVCSGGRYDNLTQNYSKDEQSGIGASFGLDRLIAALEKLEILKLKKTPAKVLCAQLEESTAATVLEVATHLREHGVAVEVYPDFAKLKKQFQYADKKGFAYMVLIGSSEAEKGEITVKNLKERTQLSVSSAPEVLTAVL